MENLRIGNVKQDVDRESTLTRLAQKAWGDGALQRGRCFEQAGGARPVVFASPALSLRGRGDGRPRRAPIA